MHIFFFPSVSSTHRPECILIEFSSLMSVISSFYPQTGLAENKRLGAKWHCNEVSMQVSSLRPHHTICNRQYIAQHVNNKVQTGSKNEVYNIRA